MAHTYYSITLDNTLQHCPARHITLLLVVLSHRDNHSVFINLHFMTHYYILSDKMNENKCCLLGSFDESDFAEGNFC